MRIVIWSILLCLLPSCLYAKNRQDLSVELISKDLRRNANAVVRSYDVEVNIEASGKDVLVSEYLVITVLNEKGLDYGELSCYESYYSSLQKVTAEVYSGNGDFLKKIKKSDFSSGTLYQGTGYYDDTKIYTYLPRGFTFPFTIVYKTSTKQTQSFYMEHFQPKIGTDCSVEQASLSISVSDTLGLQYKHFGYDEQYPGIRSGEGERTYIWRSSAILAHKVEPLEYIQYFDGTVLFSTQKFMVGKYSGSMNSWEDLSRFVYRLNDSMDSLPVSIKSKVSAMTRLLTNDVSKIDTLYRFMQKNTRYVAIEFGINGWKTMPVEYTAENKFGDCKALSYYMKALLKEAGVHSNTVLVSAGTENEDVIFKDFASPMFNHVILQVPLPDDTVWLECTSGELPAGFLSDFTQNRDVLVLLDSGGKIVHTPKYDTAYNKILRKATANCLDNGKMMIEVSIDYFGTPASEMFHHTQQKSKQELDLYVSSKFGLKSYSVENFSHNRGKCYRNMLMSEKAKITAFGMFSETSEYTWIDYDMLPLKVPEYIITTQRRSPFHISNTIKVADSFVIHIPKGKTITSLPEPMYSNHTFGSYSRKMVLMDNDLIIERVFITNQGVFEPELFSEYAQWLDSIRGDSSVQVALKK